EVDWVTGACLLVRRAVYEQIGGFDQGFFMYSEELDYCRRAVAAGWRVVYMPEAAFYHFEGKSSEQAAPERHLRFQRSKIRYFRKYHGRLVAFALWLFLLVSYAYQLALEAAKGLLGHKRAMRRERVRAYWRVLRGLAGWG
ncbi:MAG TPA: glycosyltransferase, partial [bacterium]